MQKNYLALFFLAFLLCTADMQLVAASSAIGAAAPAAVEANTAVTAVPATTSSPYDLVQKIQDAVKGAYDAFKQKYDPNGNYQVISNYIVNNPSGEQQLAQSGMSTDQMSDLGNKCFLAAAVILILGGLTVHVKFEEYFTKMIVMATNSINKNKKDGQKKLSVPASEDQIKLGKFVKTQLANVFFLVSAGLWFQGFMYFTQIALKSSETTVRELGPLLMKVVAAGLFIIQPMTSLLKFRPQSDTNSKDLDWVNYYAIIVLHIANMIGVSFAFHSKFSTFSFSGKSIKSMLPVIAGLIILIGTTFLLACDGTVTKELGSAEGKGLTDKQIFAYAIVGQGCLLIGCTFFLFQNLFA